MRSLQSPQHQHQHQHRHKPNRTYTWDYVSRATQFRETDGVAVFARVTGGDLTEPHALLIAQWRPPARQFVIELPAGLIAEGETVEDVAAREVKEETGYTLRRIVSVSPEAYNDQGTSTSRLNLAVADVDAAAPENAAPAPDHEVWVLFFGGGRARWWRLACDCGVLGAGRPPALMTSFPPILWDFDASCTYIQCENTPQNATRRQLGETIQVLLLPVRGLAARLAELKAARGWGVCSRLYSLALGLQLGAAAT